VVQGRLREQGQGIRLLLGDRGRFRGNVPQPGRGPGPLPRRDWGQVLQSNIFAPRSDCGKRLPPRSDVTL
jgi:hypothetical protein